jgi:hypothetical protein
VYFVSFWWLAHGALFSMKRVAFNISWVALTVAAFAQAPPLGHRIVLGQQEVELTNKYTSRAVAWVAQYEPVRKTNKDGPVAQWHDSMFQPATPLTGIAAGSSGRWKPAAGLKGGDFRILAVLYEDGNSFGDAGLIDSLLAARQFAYSDAAENVRLLENFQRGPGSNFGALVRGFEAPAARHTEELTAKLRAPQGVTSIRFADPVCSGIADKLKSRQNATESARASMIEAVKLDALRHYDALRAGKPALQPVPDPAGWKTGRAQAPRSVPLIEASWRIGAGLATGETRLRNNYDAAATAWVTEQAFDDGHPPELQYTDELLMDHTYPLRSGQMSYGTVRISPALPLRSLRVIAVVYADGVTAGEAKQIEGLLGRRRVILSSLPGVLQAFEAAEAQPDPKRTVLSDKADACARQIRLFLDQAGMQTDDHLCAAVARELRAPGSSLREITVRYAVRFEVVCQRLKDSGPALK